MAFEAISDDELSGQWPLSCRIPLPGCDDLLRTLLRGGGSTPQINDIPINGAGIPSGYSPPAGSNEVRRVRVQRELARQGCPEEQRTSKCVDDSSSAGIGCFNLYTQALGESGPSGLAPW